MRASVNLCRFRAGADFDGCDGRVLAYGTLFGLGWTSPGSGCLLTSGWSSVYGFWNACGCISEEYISRLEAFAPSSQIPEGLSEEALEPEV
jgi:hypothetical protein